MKNKILESYYGNDAKKLHRMVDKILMPFGGISGKDKDDFYSIANETFCDVLNRWDEVRAFDALLYTSIERKVRTEMTRRHRQKRAGEIGILSLDAPVGDEGFTLGETLIAKDEVEKVLGYSEKMLTYLSRLSKTQKDILKLIVAGYEPGEIKIVLHINDKQYTDAYDAIHAYRNVSVLF